MSRRPKIEISCTTCRMNKPAQLQMSTCVHRNRGRAEKITDYTQPCHRWTPSIRDIRVRLNRAASNGDPE